MSPWQGWGVEGRVWGREQCCGVKGHTQHSELRGCVTSGPVSGRQRLAQRERGRGSWKWLWTVGSPLCFPQPQFPHS